MNATLLYVAKALTGATTAGLAAVAVALSDGTITTLEWVGIASAVVLTFGGVFGVTNGANPNMPVEGQ